MDRDRARWEHRLRTRLTTIKLALQMLRRKPELCGAPDGPAERALEAADAVAADVERMTRERGEQSVE